MTTFISLDTAVTAEALLAVHIFGGALLALVVLGVGLTESRKLSRSSDLPRRHQTREFS
jgi:hypothetical protein